MGSKCKVQSSFYELFSLLTSQVVVVAGESCVHEGDWTVEHSSRASAVNIEPAGLQKCKVYGVKCKVQGVKCKV